ncbi:4-hydroxybenzoate polyprenyltransferase [Gelidibacter algens]|jgi:4-hydroxybenzoate polyprenyltransferase|uniref:4-hydroxybenzoate polyprenyltransferase n=1 Tax=Gelidibacter algens TaxID=49280 RepID=A0A327SFG7_9FLAO|nr:prenyltransferase [Gelidibacter algens]RAJ26423.1 4-hydroxybenzoate polyprenyltransferase [Gelidibacter algens]
MKLTLREIFFLSRPRFWMYVLGTFLVGVIASGNLFLYDASTTLLLIAFGIFFSLPANVFIYGVNDIYDYQTDIHNDKKTKYESVLKLEKHRSLWTIIVLLLLPFAPLLLSVNVPTKLALVVFLFTGLFYSATPIRAKSKPPLDVLFSAIIYVSPALVGFFITGNTHIQWLAVLGGLIWAFGMQTYSAVPDIEADKKAGVNTLAIMLGEKKALWFCLLAYLISASIGFYYVGFIAILFGIVYIVIVLLSIYNSSKLFKYYTYFPLINVITGAVLFFYLFFKEIL